MANNQTNLTPGEKTPTSNTSAQSSEPFAHFRRELVPLDEYAAREGLTSDIVEQQGQLGVIQVRKFKGRKFVVDVPVEQLNNFETGEIPEAVDIPIRQRPKTYSKLITLGLAAGITILVAGVFLLYLDARTRLNDLNSEYMGIQSRYDELVTSRQNLKSLQDELTSSRSELADVLNQIAISKAELEKIQTDLNAARRTPDTIQPGTQGQISKPGSGIEGIQKNPNASQK